MAEESDLEKTEPASSRRLEQAREEGQVPRSREVGAFLILIVSASAFWFVGSWMLQRTIAIVRRGLILEEPLMRDPQFMVVRLADLSIDALLSFTPLLLALVLAALASPFFLGSWNFSVKALNPDMGRLDPIKGLGKLVSWNGVIELVKAVAKALLVGGVAIWVLWSERNDILAIFGQPVEVGLVSAGHLINYSFLVIVLTMLLIVAVDVPFQLWQYYDKLKMSKEEVKQEGKEMEGNPEIKGRIRQLQREAARKRMMSTVPTADVIVTNPTHYAVALKYDADSMGAPRVVAKGMNLVAQNIRELASENGVPLLEAPPLARALYRHTEIGESIPAPLYTAVAEVMAWVYQLNHFSSQGGLPPQEPSDLPVPPDMDPGPGPD